MASLHILSTSPTAGSAFVDCLRVAQGTDSLLLVQDGTYAALTSAPALLAAQAEGVVVYALLADVDARGLAGRLPAGIRMVDDNGFVELTERYSRCISWY